jgi:hypothetical protein
MKASGISNLPSEFSFKSNINEITNGEKYVAKRTQYAYDVYLSDNKVCTISIYKFHRYLISGEFEVVK